jgi:hypothetical protein
MEAASSDSDYVHDDTFSEMDAEEIPKEILNAINFFNVESDEEVLRFEVLPLLTNELYCYLSCVITFDLPSYLSNVYRAHSFFFYEFRPFV